MYELDEQDKRDATKFIVGTWEVEYIVNAFSNDLAHIPAAEFKSADGLDFTAVKFNFLQDGTLELCNGNETFSGTWEPTGLCEYKYHIAELESVPDSPFKDNAEKLNVFDGKLCFAIGFLSICMNKTAEGEYSEPVKVDVIAESEDDGGKEIVGKYAIYKVMSCVDGNFDLFTKDEIRAYYDKKTASGEIDDGEEDVRNEALAMFDSFVEFTDDNRLVSWYKLPDGVGEDEIKAALAEGEISDYRDGYAVVDKVKEWKSVGGKYYYNSGSTAIIMGEAVSPWKELTTDEDGCISFADGLMMLKKI